MKSVRRIALALLSCALMYSGTSFAGSDLNEVGAILVYPMVSSAVGTQETYVTITNTSALPVRVHVSFVDGFEGTPQFPNPRYCFECDFSLEMTGRDTDVMVILKNATGGTDMFTEAGALMHSCEAFIGMIIVTLENQQGETITDNVLLGSEVIVDYASGYAVSIPAIPFQGSGGGDGDHHYNFDDQEFGKLPRIVATDFIAPDPGNVGGVTAELALFTPGFKRGRPPLTDCSVTGFDADENPFSRSFTFGCWTLTSLWDISNEFAYPNLGLSVQQSDTHGWFQLSCRVDATKDGVFEINGGVHGTIIQKAMGPGLFGPGAVIRRNDPGASGVATSVAWARTLYQSVTTGDPLTLQLD